VWPVSLAKYAADLRDGERQLLAAETLLALTGAGDGWVDQRRRAEWVWVMLSDHAWNGTDADNKAHNADLRRQWSEELTCRAGELVGSGWEALATRSEPQCITVANTLSVSRRALVSLDLPAEGDYVLTDGDQAAPCQLVGQGDQRALWAVSPELPGFSLRRLTLRPAEAPANRSLVRATPALLESPFYRLRIEPARGGVTSLVHKPSGRELIARDGAVLGQTVYFDGEERVPGNITCEVAAEGPVSAGVRLMGEIGGMLVVTDWTVYSELDRVHVNVLIRKPVTTAEERLCHVFPVAAPGAVVRVETPGAVIRPYPQPQGDLLPGADPHRFAVQGFVDVSLPDGPGVTIAPHEAFVLRMDLDPITFEALGNDQNHREVIQDQHGVTEFAFSYTLRAHEGPYRQPEAVAWSRDAATPFLSAKGAADELPVGVEIDPSRAIATCLKPADEPGRGVILRVWETANQAGPLPVGAQGFSRAVRTDLLERDLEELPVRGGRIALPIRALGLAAVRLLR